ncbi:DUF3192 domain-containing protein [Candidatus Omnitrophota bacterium]
MKKLLLAVICFGLIGCATSIDRIFLIDRGNLSKLAVGMTKENVATVMRGGSPKGKGIEGADGVIRYFTLDNVYRSEKFVGDNVLVDVFYYVTTIVREDGIIVDDELTPVIFEENRFTGWGWPFLQTRLRKYRITRD